MSDICAVTGLFHVLVKSNDLPQTLKFYKEVLGLREAPRPAFGNPGAWMAVSTPIGEQIIHGPAAPAWGRPARRPTAPRRSTMSRCWQSGTRDSAGAS